MRLLPNKEQALPATSQKVRASFYVPRCAPGRARHGCQLRPEAGRESGHLRIAGECNVCRKGQRPNRVPKRHLPQSCDISMRHA